MCSKKETTTSNPTYAPTTYKNRLPKTSQFTTHFSSLLFSGSLPLTCLEFAIILLLFIVSLDPSHDVSGSFPFLHLPLFLLTTSLFRRFYNTYLEACYFHFPSHRTQPPKEHLLIKNAKDLSGRSLDQLHALHYHDLLTYLTTTLLYVSVYFLLPGFYPTLNPPQPQTFLERLARLTLNHLIMSFGMYWLHRSAHNVPALWRIHQVHHWAKHPLSRNTYEDHWFDNFSNLLVGHICSQILVPLDYPTFLFSHISRIAESLEKHSGISSPLNLAHQGTRLFIGWAQMPHHHDWHHEGNKGSNYTFSSIGGVWDVLFKTRHEGRVTPHEKEEARDGGEGEGKDRRKNRTSMSASVHARGQSTGLDKGMRMKKEKGEWKRINKGWMDRGWGSMTPVAGVVAAAAIKIWMGS